MTPTKITLTIASVCALLAAAPGHAQSNDSKPSDEKSTMSMKGKSDKAMMEKSDMSMKSKSSMGMKSGDGMSMKKNAAMGMMKKSDMSMKSKSGMGMKAKSGMMAMKGSKMKAAMGPNILDTLSSNIKGGMNADTAFTLALQNPTRPLSERTKDIDRKPQQVLEFAGIKPGHRVLNLLSYYGYYAEVLAYRVGETGEVFAQNTPTYSSTGENIKERLMEHPLANVKPTVVKLEDIKIDKPVDAILFMSSYHDFYGYLVKDKKERIKILKNLKNSLKRGGSLVVSDMVEAKGEHNPKMHRIHKDIVLGELKEAGFKLVASSDILRKPELDDHTTIGYDKKRFYTDRWLVKMTH